MRLALIASAALALVAPAFAQHRGGVGVGSGSRPGSRIGARRSFAGGPVYVPYPIYGAGYAYDGFYANDYPTAPANEEQSAYQPAPTVIINQNFQTEPVRPQLRDYSNMQLPPPGTVMVPPAPALPDDQPTIFLIAMQDHSIIPVIAYWVQGETLNYISLKTVPNQVSLSIVDRDFSKKLNADRHVPFALPAPR
jgi:hypothetical protein